VPVKLGYSEGPWVEIRDGLQPGDQVVTAGKVALRDGSRVQVIAPQREVAEVGGGAAVGAH